MNNAKSTSPDRPWLRIRDERPLRVHHEVPNMLVRFLLRHGIHMVFRALGALLLLSVALKLVHLAPWSWGWALSPFWAILGLIVRLWILMAAGVVSTGFDREY